MNLSWSRRDSCRLGEQCKTEAIQKIQKSWETVVEQLINQYFVDAKSGKQKNEIFWGTDDVIQWLRTAVQTQEENTSSTLKEYVDSIVHETEIIDLNKITRITDFLDEQSKIILTEQLKSTLDKIDARCSLEKAGITKYVKKISKAIGKAVDALEQQLKIKRKQLLEFKDKIFLIIKNIISSIFDNRVELLTKAIAQAIAFYNDFLERQERYQQETPEQREAEKAWIAQKWGELKKVQNGIEAILNAS